MMTFIYCIFLSYTQYQQPPNWVDIGGFIVSCLSLVAAGIAAWKLLKRDKDMAAQVDALTQLAFISDQNARNADRIRTIDIQPDFSFVSSEFIRAFTYKVTFVNHGGPAIQFSIGKSDSNLINHRVPTDAKQDLILTMSNEQMEDQFFYKDVDGLEYFQDVSFIANIHTHRLSVFVQRPHPKTDLNNARTTVMD